MGRTSVLVMAAIQSHHHRRQQDLHRLEKRITLTFVAVMILFAFWILIVPETLARIPILDMRGSQRLARIYDTRRHGVICKGNSLTSVTPQEDFMVLS